MEMLKRTGPGRSPDTTLCCDIFDKQALCKISYLNSDRNNLSISLRKYRTYSGAQRPIEMGENITRKGF